MHPETNYYPLIAHRGSDTQLLQDRLCNASVIQRERCPAIRESIDRLIATEVRASKNKTSNSNSTVSFTFKLLPKQISFRKDCRIYFISNCASQNTQKKLSFSIRSFNYILDFIISKNNKKNILKYFIKFTHTCTRTRTRARTHTHTHTHTRIYVWTRMTYTNKLINFDVKQKEKMIYDFLLLKL